MNKYKYIHTFHIPVMGLAYTIDSPAKVAHFGITSVVSIIEDTLIERMRQYYYAKINEPYYPIQVSEPDYRSRRITDYLNLLNRIVEKQIEKLKASTFEAGSDIVLYFEMLPETSILKKMYLQMLAIRDRHDRMKAEHELRKQIRAGSIDVNIMTKLDNEHYHADGTVIEDGSDAVTALRGYVNSDLTDSSIVFSAGMNPRLYNYLERVSDVFNQTQDGEFVKKITVKVSDFRSAIIQGKFLAKKGLWVSEFRVESGLNCGGHTFASDGYMLGPILEEFKNKRESLTEELFEVYCKAQAERGKTPPAQCPPIKLTVQGGIGTHEEDSLMRNYYGADGTGWGSPFMLVPESITIDDDTLSLLAKAAEEDVVLSRNSPLGVRFNYLKGASGEVEKYQKVKDGHPGSPCSEKFLQYNTEFTERPICTASTVYLKKKLQQLKDANISEEERSEKISKVLTKECLCVGLSNTAIVKYHLPLISKSVLGVTACPGPNIAYFDRQMTLREMVDHIYGRTNMLRKGYRPHVFIKELQIYITYLEELLTEETDLGNPKQIKYYKTFCKNMQDAVTYYQQIAGTITTDDRFLTELGQIEEKIGQIEASIVA